MSSKLLSTVEVERETKIPRATLQYWIKEGKIVPAPKIKRLRDGVAVRLWTAVDVERARQLQGILKRGPKPGSRAKKGKKNSKV